MKDKNPKGRPKKIPTPELMWNHFTKYREWVKNNPIRVQDYVGKDAEMVYRDKQRPLTLEGFEVWCFENDIIADISNYFENKDNAYEEFLPICRMVRRIIREDQVSGGMVGIFNPSITQRLNGLVEKVEQKNIVEGIDIVIK